MKKPGVFCSGRAPTTGRGLGGYDIATVSSKINPTDSVIPTFSVGLSKGRGWSNRSSTGIAFLIIQKRFRALSVSLAEKLLCAIGCYHLTG